MAPTTPLTDALVHIGFNRPELFKVILNNRAEKPQAAVVSVTHAFEYPLLHGSVNPIDGQLYGNLDKIPVALVNADAGATVGGKRLAAGSDLVHELLDRKTFAPRIPGGVRVVELGEAAAPPAFLAPPDAPKTQE